MTPGAVKLRESLQQSWRVYLSTKLKQKGTKKTKMHFRFSLRSLCYLL